MSWFVIRKKFVCLNITLLDEKTVREKDIKHSFPIPNGVRDFAYVIPHFIHISIVMTIHVNAEISKR